MQCVVVSSLSLVDASRGDRSAGRVVGRSGSGRVTGEAPLPLPAAGGPGCRLGRAPKPTLNPGGPGSWLKQVRKPSRGCGGLRSSRASGSISEVGGGGLTSGSCGWPPTGLYGGRSGEVSGAPCGLRRHFCVVVCSGEVLARMGRVSMRSGTVTDRGSPGMWWASLVRSRCGPEFTKQFWRGGLPLVSHPTPLQRHRFLYPSREHIIHQLIVGGGRLLTSNHKMQSVQ
ncbi:uncharacterized protein LOC134357601 [Mobula hypostoma]|uniref:uncharacterized protein LOC134357601 n=1 Tax=Mobula hypostoma TaxID=723540 RepID=UPI002FC304C8